MQADESLGGDGGTIGEGEEVTEEEIKQLNEKLQGLEKQIQTRKETVENNE